MTGINSGNHNLTLSCVKAIGIILIVVGHAAQWIPWLRDGVYLFHVGLFFFVAGFFFRDDSLATPVKYTFSKLRRLYVPYVTAGTLFVLLHNLLLRLHIIGYDFSASTPMLPYTASDVAHRLLGVFTMRYFEQPLMTTWFLQGMLFGLMIYYATGFVCRKLFTRHFELMRTLTVVVLASVTFITVHYGIMIQGLCAVSRAFVFAALIHAGHLYALYGSKIPLKWYYALPCLVVICLGAGFGCEINIGGMRYGNPALFVLFTASGIYMTFTVANYIARWNSAFTKVMDYIGSRTMSIMLLHPIAFKLVSFVEVVYYGYSPGKLGWHPSIPANIEYWWPVYTLAGIALPLAADALYEYIAPQVCKWLHRDKSRAAA